MEFVRICLDDTGKFCPLDIQILTKYQHDLGISICKLSASIGNLSLLKNSIKHSMSLIGNFELKKTISLSDKNQSLLESVLSEKLFTAICLKQLDICDFLLSLKTNNNLPLFKPCKKMLAMAIDRGNTKITAFALNFKNELYIYQTDRMLFDYLTYNPVVDTDMLTLILDCKDNNGVPFAIPFPGMLTIHIGKSTINAKTLQRYFNLRNKNGEPYTKPTSEMLLVAMKSRYRCSADLVKCILACENSEGEPYVKPTQNILSESLKAYWLNIEGLKIFLNCKNKKGELYCIPNEDILYSAIKSKHIDVVNLLISRTDSNGKLIFTNQQISRCIKQHNCFKMKPLLPENNCRKTLANFLRINRPEAPSTTGPQYHSSGGVISFGLFSNPFDAYNDWRKHAITWRDMLNDPSVNFSKVTQRIIDTIWQDPCLHKDSICAKVLLELLDETKPNTGQQTNAFTLKMQDENYYDAGSVNDALKLLRQQLQDSFAINNTIPKTYMQSLSAKFWGA